MSEPEINSSTIGPKKICGAKGKRNGRPCPRPPMANGRCYHHGGASTGGLRGPANGNYRNGRYTKQAKAERRILRELLREARDEVKRVRLLTDNLG